MKKLNKKALIGLGLASVLCQGPVLAQAETQDPVTDKSESTEEGVGSKKKERTEVMQVTGSRIRQIDMETSASMTSFDRKQLEDSGFATVADFIRNAIPSASMMTENATLSQISGSSDFSGRDFSSDYTLVLVNGRRMPVNAIAADFVDLNLIPMAAVERIDYVTDGSSAIYGSDAVAGVLNIITRKSFEGVSVSGRVAQSSRGDGLETSYEVVGGTSSDRANFLITADFFKREAVQASDRPLIDSAIAPDGTDGRSPTGLPGYIIRADGSREPFENCPAERSIGGVCYYDYAPLYQVSPETTRRSVYSIFDYRLNDYMDAYGEIRYSQTATKILNGAAPGAVAVSGSSAFNPYPGEDIVVARRYLDFGPRRRDSTNESFSTIAGLRGTIGFDHNWSIEIASHKLRNLQIGVGGQINEDSAIEAFDKGILNPFEFNQFDTPEKLEAYNSIDTTTFREGQSDLQTYALSFDGLLPLELGGGFIGYATGLEYRQEDFQDRSDNLSSEGKILGGASSDGKGERENTAAYVEVALPLHKMADLSLAARHDRIDYNKNKTTYKLSSVFAPVEFFKLRASYGTGFKAPNMHDLFLGKSFGASIASDAKTCGDQETCQINSISSGNPDLEPEESIAYNIGVLSQVTGDLSFRIDYWDIEIKNKVSPLSVQTILNNEEKYAALINRDQQGLLNTNDAFVESILENLTTQRSAGLELGMNYSQRTSLGRFSSTLLLNKIIKSLSQTSDNQPLCDYAKYSTVDGILNFDWTNSVYSAGSTFRYKGGYTSFSGGLTDQTCDMADPDSAYKVKGVTEVDFRLGYNAPFGTQLALGIINAFDAEPAFDPNARWPWYNQEAFSNMGAQYYVSVSHQFQ